jgi:hypothetical protein
MLIFSLPDSKHLSVVCNSAWGEGDKDYTTQKLVYPRVNRAVPSVLCGPELAKPVNTWLFWLSRLDGYIPFSALFDGGTERYVAAIPFPHSNAIQRSASIADSSESPPFLLFPLWRNSPTWARATSFLRFLDHTQ